MQNFGIYLNFTVALVTKLADKIGLKQRNCHFEPDFKSFGERFFKN